MFDQIRFGEQLLAACIRKGISTQYYKKHWFFFRIQKKLFSRSHLKFTEKRARSVTRQNELKFRICTKIVFPAQTVENNLSDHKHVPFVHYPIASIHTYSYTHNYEYSDMTRDPRYSHARIYEKCVWLLCSRFATVAPHALHYRPQCRIRCTDTLAGWLTASQMHAIDENSKRWMWYFI